MSAIEKDLGLVTAYGYAKTMGYRGTPAEFAAMLARAGRVTSLNDTPLICGAVEAADIPQYVADVSEYAAYGIADAGWYVFARISAPEDAPVSAATTVTGAAGAILQEGADHVDVAVRFEVAAASQAVTVTWVEGRADTFIFKATDLAVRNLDYRTTFYVYDAAPFAHWTYVRTADTTFQTGKNYYRRVIIRAAGDYYELAEVEAGATIPVYYNKQYSLTQDTAFQNGTTYYTKDGDTYTAASVTPGAAIPAETYYVEEYVVTESVVFDAMSTYYTKNGDTYTEAAVEYGEQVPAYYTHSKITFEGMARNITYRLDEIIDCPMEFILPEIEDETHGCWFEIRCRHAGEYSMTLIPPSSDVKIATEHTQKETAGINMIDLHYTVIDGLKIWRFLNTHSSIPA